MKEENWISSSKKPNPNSFKDYVIDDELKNLVEGKRVALVGQGSKLKGKGNGALIDSYDVVIRVGQIYPIDEDVIEDRGSKTDVIMYSFNVNQIPESRKNINFFKEVGFVICSMITGKEVKMHADFFGFMRNHGITVYKPDDGYFYKIFSEVGTILNSGISGIMMLLNYDIKELYVTGFDFYNMGKYGNVYFDSHYNKSVSSKVFVGGSPANQMTEKTGRHDLHNQNQQIKYLRKESQENPDIIKLDDYLKENLLGIINEKNTMDDFKFNFNIKNQELMDSLKHLQINNSDKDYIERSEDEYKCLKSLLFNKEVKSILDIGSGIGRSSVYFKNMEKLDNTTFYLADFNGSEFDKQKGCGEHENANPIPYNDLDVTRLFCENNHMNMSNVEILDLNTSDLDKVEKVDIVYSFHCIGYHWQIKEAFDKYNIEKHSTDETVLVFGVRINKEIKHFPKTLGDFKLIDQIQGKHLQKFLVYKKGQ